MNILRYYYDNSTEECESVTINYEHIKLDAEGLVEMGLEVFEIRGEDNSVFMRCFFSFFWYVPSEPFICF